MLYGLLYSLVAGSLVALVISPIANKLPAELLVLTPREPKIVQQDSAQMPKVVTQVLHDDAHIYLMYGKIGTVQIYNLDGDYEYTISIDKPRKRMSWLALHDGQLYIRVKAGNLYVFQDDSLQFYLSDDEADTFADSINFDKTSDVYRMRFSSVWRTDEAGSTRIIVRPFWMGFFQISEKLALTLWLSSITLFSLLLIVAKIQDHYWD